MKTYSAGLLLLVLLNAPGVAHACSCNYAGDFSLVADDMPLVVTARIKAYGRAVDGQSGTFQSMLIDAIQVLKGDYSRAELRILGDNGMLCRASISEKRFPVGGRFAFALRQPEQEEAALSVCGEYWASVVGDEIRGNTLKGSQYERYRKPLSEVFNDERLELLRIVRVQFWQALAGNRESVMADLLSKRFEFHGAGGEKQDQIEFLAGLRRPENRLIWEPDYPVNLATIEMQSDNTARIESVSAVMLPAVDGTIVQPFRAAFELEKDSSGWRIVSVSQQVHGGI